MDSLTVASLALVAGRAKQEREIQRYARMAVGNADDPQAEPYRDDE